MDAATCQSMASVISQTIVNRWNSYHGTLGYIPALLDGSSSAAVVSLVEGLAYPAVMGLTNAIDRSGGPYAAMLQALSNHLWAVLVPGKCLDATCGAWLSTSATPTISWQSKNFICQYVAEAVLGISNNVNGAVDQIHASMQVQDAPLQGYSDALNGTGVFQYSGGVHYPRGITTALWWLNASNNLAYPVATSAPSAPTVFFAVAGDRQVLLLWQGVSLAIGYNLKRATVSGGPYAPLTNRLTSASFTDTNVQNGTTYYYLLTATNQIGESAPSPETSATPVPSAGTNLTAALMATRVTISWPSNYVGWILQTNLDLRNPTAWGDVQGSPTNSQITLPKVDPTLPRQFFRLRHP